MVHVARAAPRLFTQWTHSSAAWNERFPKWAPEISICSSFQLKKCEFAGSLMIWYDMIFCESHMKTRNSPSMLILRFLQAWPPVLLALQPLQAPFQQVVPPLHTPKLPFVSFRVSTAPGKLGGWSNPSETYGSKWESSPQSSGWT